MDNIAVYFEKEVLKWRTGAALGWSVILVLPVTVLFQLLAAPRLLRPDLWLLDGVLSVVWPSNWFLLVTVAAALVGLTLIEHKQYSVVPRVVCTRWEYVRLLASVKGVLFGLWHGLVAAVIVRAHLQLSAGRWSSWTKSCDAEGSGDCLNEGYVFLLLHGVALGWLYSVDFSLTHSHLAFPFVQQPKLFQVKNALSPMLSQSLSAVFRSIKLFFPLYYILLGGVCRDVLMSTLGVAQDDQSSLDRLWNMLDLSLFLQTTLSGLYIHLLFSINNVLYKVYHTEPFPFLLDVPTEAPDSKTKPLQGALSSKNPLVQYLAYLDLRELSRCSLPRREVIFSLSQLGSHPRNWEYVSTEGLAALDTLTNAVADFNHKAVSNGALRLPQDIPPYLKAPEVTTLTAESVGSPDKGTKPKDDKKAAPKLSFVDGLKKTKAVTFFTSTLPDTSSQKLFADSQKQIWAAEALSYLAAASYHEDTYGVVQKTLPDIIVAMLGLQEAVEKHMKLGLATTRHTQRGPPPLCQVLRSTLKTSLS